MGVFANFLLFLGMQAVTSTHSYVKARISYDIGVKKNTCVDQNKEAVLFILTTFKSFFLIFYPLPVFLVISQTEIVFDFLFTKLYEEKTTPSLLEVCSILIMVVSSMTLGVGYVD